MAGWDDYDDDFESGQSAGEDDEVPFEETKPVRSLERATTRTLTSTFDLDDLDDGDSAGGTAPAVDWLRSGTKDTPVSSAGARSVAEPRQAEPQSVRTVQAQPRQEAAAAVETPARVSEEPRSVAATPLGDAAARSRPRPPKHPPSADRSRIPRAGTVKAPRQVKASASVQAPPRKSPTRDTAMDSGRQPFGRISVVKPKVKRTKEQEERGNAVVQSYAESHPYERQMSNADARVQSAASKKVAKLRNQLTERERELAEALQEVKTLKIQMRRQDKAIDKMTKEEGDMPTILARKEDEIRTLEEFNRRGRDKLNELIAELKSKDKQLATLTSQKRALEKLVADKGLKSRKSLTNKVESLTADLQVKNNEVARLEKLVQQAQRLKKRQKKQEGKEAVSLVETVALRREIEVLRETLERERRVNSLTLPGRAKKQAAPNPPAASATTAAAGAAQPTQDSLAVFLTESRSTPSPDPAASRSAQLLRSLPDRTSATRASRSPSPKPPPAEQRAKSTVLTSPQPSSPSPKPSASDSAAAETARAAEAAAAAQRAAEEAAEESRKQKELEEQRERDLEAQRQREAEEAKKQAEQEAKKKAEEEAARAAAEAEAQRKAELLKKLAALDEEKPLPFAVKPAPETPEEKVASPSDDDALPWEIKRPSQPTTASTGRESGEVPQPKAPEPQAATKAEPPKAEEAAPEWLTKKTDPATPQVARKSAVPDLQASFDTVSIGSTSSRRSRRDLPQASRESENLHRGWPASGPLNSQIGDETSRVSTGKSQTGTPAKLGAAEKAVLPGIAPKAAAPPPRVSETSSSREMGALPSIGQKSTPRNRGRLGGPARGGGSNSLAGFHGPKRKKPSLPWEKNGQAPQQRPTVTADDIDDLDTIAI